MGLETLSDILLVETYKKAISLNLGGEFTNLLREEIKRRNLQVDN